MIRNLEMAKCLREFAALEDLILVSKTHVSNHTAKGNCTCRGLLPSSASMEACAHGHIPAHRHAHKYIHN